MDESVVKNQLIKLVEDMLVEIDAYRPPGVTSYFKKQLKDITNERNND